MSAASRAALGVKDTTRDLRRRVSVKFGRTSGAMHMPEHAVLFEVPVDGVRRWDGGEMPCRRSIDAVAIGLWKRTGHLVHGFEIKATRADLRAELRDPDKSEPARRLCDRWWLVIADRKLLGDDAPPEGWGVLHASGRGLRVLVEPEPIVAERDPRFVAALVQSALRSHGTCAGLARVDGYLSGYKKGLAIGEEHGRRREAMRQRLQELGLEAAS